MKIKLLRGQTLPKKSHPSDAGADIFLNESFAIDPLETKTIGLAMCVSIPEGFAGMIVPRSSIARRGLIIQTAIIDPGYTGEIHLIATNCSNETLCFSKGDRLCSIACVSVLNFYAEEAEEMPSSQRGDKGMGSTGR